jgi:hypothetical protein
VSDRQSRAAGRGPQAVLEEGGDLEIAAQELGPGRVDVLDQTLLGSRAHRALDLLLDRRARLVEGPLPLLAGVAEGKPIRAAQRRRGVVPRPPPVLEVQRPASGQMAMDRGLGVDGDVLVQSRAPGRGCKPPEIALGDLARRRLVGGSRRPLRRRVGRGGELVLEDPGRVDAASGQHRLGGFEHRRRPAHVDVGRGELLVDGLVHEPTRDGDEAKIGQPLAQRGDLIQREQVALLAGAVVEAHRALAPFGGQLAQDAEHRGHSRAAGDHQDRCIGAPQVKGAVRPGQAQLSLRLNLIAEHAREPSPRVALDHQLDRIVARKAGDRERAPDAIGSRHVEVDVLTRQPRELVVDRQLDADDVVGEVGHLGHGGLGVADRVLEAIIFGVEVQQLDDNV